ncbi:Hypothetical predicted protein [Mytilus galloprovincialis]|uniref:Endonuclease/exonuclease/phosphatase domain-containing protein n=1 Tax=Mytilus galloprovincialis TaxID=29158 RepID=A0A8B6GKR9_MYTGA|nr:Hypothetical predicted protein [Mytilus galloprovincialis]
MSKHFSSHYSLKTAMWNIEGLTTDKSQDPYFLETISKFHIVSFVETWSNSDPKLSLPEFNLISSSSRKKHKKARRHSGGINIFVKKSINNGVKSIHNDHSDIAWVILDHTFFNLKRDIYLAAVYVSPENSSCNVPDLNSVYAHLLSDIEKYCKLGDIMVQGDFNAHTNTSPDYVLFDESKQPYVVDNYYVEDSIMPRNNLDKNNPKRINNSGRCLLDQTQTY